jgi:hypothetical protein
LGSLLCSVSRDGFFVFLWRSQLRSPFGRFFERAVGGAFKRHLSKRQRGQRGEQGVMSRREVVTHVETCGLYKAKINGFKNGGSKKIVL